jgi:hypothetical protein
MKYSRTAIVGLGVVGLVVVGLLISQSVAVASNVLNSRHKSWSAASNTLGDRGTLYQPTFTAGLKISGGVQVIAFGRKGNSTSTYSYASTSVSAAYGKRAKNFNINEKWAKTAWAVKLQPDPSQGRVGAVKIPMGMTGSMVRAEVFANCGDRKCSQRDVMRTGGYLTVKSKLTSTDIVIQSNGLTFNELLRVVSGLKPVP